MVEIEIHIPAQASSASIPRRIEQACAAEGLRLTLKDTLAGYPGCVHWHYKKGKERGTLEITWWEAKRRLWFKVAAGRTGEWMEAALEKLKNIMAEEEASLAAPRTTSNTSSPPPESPQLRL